MSVQLDRDTGRSLGAAWTHHFSHSRAFLPRCVILKPGVTDREPCQALLLLCHQWELHCW